MDREGQEQKEEEKQEQEKKEEDEEEEEDRRRRTGGGGGTEEQGGTGAGGTGAGGTGAGGAGGGGGRQKGCFFYKKNTLKTDGLSPQLIGLLWGMVFEGKFWGCVPVVFRGHPPRAPPCPRDVVRLAFLKKQSVL